MSLSERTFGVEIEHGNRNYSCYGPNKIQDVLIAGGHEAWARGAHEDGSGIELKSPILKGEDGLAELKEVMAFLKEKGGYTGGQDGLHTHHGAGDILDMNKETLTHIIKSWSANQVLINTFLPERRITGVWAERVCKQVTTNLAERICNSINQPPTARDYSWCLTAQQQRMAKQEEARLAGMSNKDLIKYAVGHNDRFVALNICSLQAHETIEIRQMYGTLEFDPAAAWIVFGQRFLESCVERKRAMGCFDSPESLLENIGVEKKYQTTLLTGMDKSDADTGEVDYEEDDDDDW